MRKGLIVTVILFSLVLALPVVADTNATEKLLGDESDGSRAIPAHLIPLYDEENAELDKKSYKIFPDDKLLLPFSTRQTCGMCHSYQTISNGWHFNATDANIVPGQPGEPWILVDSATGTQIPLSYRPWPGVYHPEQLGITPFQFTCLFGGHTAGGGPAELESDNIDEIARQGISGKLEINCLTCHNAHPGQDQIEYAFQISQQNFRWAATAACGFASVSGSAKKMGETYDYLMPVAAEDAPTVTYRKDAFDHKYRVLFDIVRKVPNERCYFCHSNIDAGNDLERWAADEDVHLTAGLTCVDCHRNDISHNITRGYEGEDTVSKNPLAATTSCVGCHTEGRLGAPVPKHQGIPPVHFDKLSCTVCHSGPWPEEKTILTKTSMAHRLGVLGSNKSPEALPHIFYPVFAKQQGIGAAYLGNLSGLRPDEKIAPCKLIWPAFWGSIKDDKITPAAIETVRKTAGKILAKTKRSPSGDWRDLNSELITEGLKELQKTIDGEPIYISGGKVHRLDDEGKLISSEHAAASPYLWPIAHNVRPAAQSLGVRSCGDCHSIDAPSFFGIVAVDSPIVAERDLFKEMIEFQGLRPVYTKLFAFSFIFRPFIKVVSLCSSAILAAVLILYVFQGLVRILNLLSGKNQ